MKMTTISTDKELGLEVFKHLQGKKLENPLTSPTPLSGMTQDETIRRSFRDIMMALGIDLNDDSTAGTPKRVSKMYCEEIFGGLDYSNFPSCTTFPNKAGHDEMVCVKDIEVKSMCEHHFMPFVGTAIVAYIPAAHILGLSKFNRIVDFFSRRPQIQERLTEQIAETLSFILKTDDIAVVVQAKHMCTSFRGVEDFLSSTVTSKLMGKFRDVAPLRSEFIGLSRGGNNGN